MGYTSSPSYFPWMEIISFLPASTNSQQPHKNGHPHKKPVRGYCKRIGHSTEQCYLKAENQPEDPSISPYGTTPRATPGSWTKAKGPAPSYGTVAGKDYSRTYCPTCKVHGHSAQWAKCPNNNKSSRPALALAVTDPVSLGPPAQGPIYVALSRLRCPTSQVKAFDDSDAQMPLIREDKAPCGAIINRLVTNEGINHFKMILPTVKLKVTRPHRSEIYDLAVARYIPGGTSKPQTPDFLPLPLPPECNVQWPPPPRSIPDPIPVPGPAPVPVPAPQVDPPPGDLILDSQSLPVSFGCTGKYPAPSVPNDNQIPNQLLVPGPALVPVPEHSPDVHSRYPSPGLLSSPVLAPLPMPVRETDPSDQSRSSPKGAASQPVPELVILTCEPLMPPTTASATDTTVSKDSAMSQVADELNELRQIMVELVKRAPVSAVKKSTQVALRYPPHAPFHRFPDRDKPSQ
ncbi:helicase SRCAP-like [Macrobrachium rosenbergii]|uniref:helicase SRCAP-like n=1 Tax=Macrobrachium rosenbergii TaxID=79674 RepID=UPI0034D65B52